MVDIDTIAKVCHEANRAYCASMGDHSQLAWEQAPEWQKESAKKGVMFHVKHPEATPENSHESWLAEKEMQGWSWGPVKRPDQMRHPCMVPYESLPANQKAKDYIFRAIVHAMTGEQE